MTVNLIDQVKELGLQFSLWSVTLQSTDSTIIDLQMTNVIVMFKKILIIFYNIHESKSKLDLP